MRTLRFILNDVLNEKDVSEEMAEYIDELSQKIDNTDSQKINRNILTKGLADILPADQSQLEAIMMALQSLPENKLSANGSIAVSTFLVAISYKLGILANHNPSLATELENLRVQKSTSESKESLEKLNTDIKKLENVALVTENIRENTPEGKLLRVDIILKMLDRVILNSPRYILNFPSSKDTLTFESLRMAHTHRERLVEAINNPLTKPEMIKELIKACLSECSHATEGAVNAIENRIQFSAKAISASSHSPLQAELEELKIFTETLSHAVIMSANDYQMLADKFVAKYNGLLASAIQYIESKEETEFRVREDAAKEFINAQFPSNKFPFLLNASDLRQSGNTFVVDQGNLTIRYYNDIKDESKFIICGKEPENLSQIAKDAERNLRIEGEKGQWSLANQPALKEFLISKFGEENAAHLIRHYDQGVSLVLAAGIGDGAKVSDDLMDTENPVVQQSVFTQNLYQHSGLVFRDTEIDHLIISVPEDEAFIAQHLKEQVDKAIAKLPADEQAKISDEDRAARYETKRQELNTQWKFKANAKILSWVNKDGFAVEGVGSDSPLVCNALMNNAKGQLRAIVDVILSLEKQLIVNTGKQMDKTYKFSDKEEKLENIKNKLDVLRNAQIDINKFKNGEITLDQLTNNFTQLHKLSKEIPHMGPISSFAKYDSGVTVIMKKFCDELAVLKELLDTNAQDYKRQSGLLQTPQLESQRTSPRFR